MTQASDKQVQHSEAHLVRPIEVVDDEEHCLFLRDGTQEFVRRLGEPKSRRSPTDSAARRAGRGIGAGFQEGSSRARPGFRGWWRRPRGARAGTRAARPIVAYGMLLSSSKHRTRADAGSLQCHGGRKTIGQRGLADSAVSQ